MNLDDNSVLIRVIGLIISVALIAYGLSVIVSMLSRSCGG